MRGILITGGTQGIGRGIAEFYTGRGFHAFLNYLSQTSVAEGAAKAILDAGGSCSLHQADVRVEADVAGMCEAIAESGHQLETLVINAVDEVPKAVDEATFDEWHRVLLTKLDGAFLSLKYAIPLLRKADNPAVAFITSSDGWRPTGEYVAYQVGTAGLIAMANGNSKYLAKKYGIRVNCVSPGPVRTGLWKKAGEAPNMWEDYAARNPLGRVATVEDVAAAVWTLSEDPRKFLNGTMINVDGGTQWR